MLSAILQTPAGAIAVRLRDVSQTGALIVSPVQPPVGSNVAFVRGPIWVAATVIRIEGSNVALRFREAIDKAALLVTIGRREAMPKSPARLFAESLEPVPSYEPLVEPLVAKRAEETLSAAKSGRASR